MAFRFPPELEATDEAFWRQQESRKRGLLGQPCCTQSKASWAMMNVPGEFAVVIHGEFDCLNCFHHHLGQSAHRYFSTRLTDHQITTGETQAPLEHLLRMIVAERSPEAILVLGTCPVEVIGDRFEVVVERLSSELDVPMLSMRTSGLKMSSLTDCQDWLFDTLASLPQAEPVDRGWFAEAEEWAMDVLLRQGDLSVERSERLHAQVAELSAPVAPSGAHRANFLGLPGAHREPVGVLRALGLAVNGFYPHGASLADWRSISAASVTFAVDAAIFPRLSRRLEGYGQALIPVTLPVGVDATTQFYHRIAEQYGCEDRLDTALAEELKGARERVAAFRERYAGVKLGMAIRMLNTHQVDRLVQDGLGDASHLKELGFDIHLFIQGPPEEGPKFAERLTSRGIAYPVRTFPGPWALADHMVEAGCEVCHVPDSSRNIVRRAGLPMISSRALHPWLSGVEHNLVMLGDLVEQGWAMRGGR